MTPKSGHRFSDEVMREGRIMIPVQLSGTFLSWE
jgi:hypothetical protein